MMTTRNQFAQLENTNNESRSDLANERHDDESSRERLEQLANQLNDISERISAKLEFARQFTEEIREQLNLNRDNSREDDIIRSRETTLSRRLATSSTTFSHEYRDRSKTRE